MLIPRSRLRWLPTTLLAALSLLWFPSPVAAQVPSPETHFGFRMGADRQLATAASIESYFEAVASRSDRVKIVDLGPTTDGHRTIAAIVTAPENVKLLDQIRAANQRLADPRTLTPEDAHRLAATHKAVLAIGGSIHASEPGATQAANELLYSLATSTEAPILNVLQNVIVILIPSLNPDGHRLVVDWYERQKGTPFEGGPLPWLDHKYAGHDINRDAFMMNLAESRNLARFFYTEWHPQVFLTIRQRESDGPRFVVPSNGDPIIGNYDPLIGRTAALLASAMALELQRDRHPGVMSNGLSANSWPGSEDSAPLGHNTVCLLTEVASVKVATPIGSWTLRDIVEYDLSAVSGLLYAVAAYREQIVQNFYEMGRRAVEAGQAGGPFAFLIPPEQHDPHATAKLKELLQLGGIEVHRALEPFRADGDPYPAGSDIIFLAQPYRAYVKTLLERQSDPAAGRAPRGAQADRPYDVTGWTLSQQMGVDVRTIERTFEPPAMSRLTGSAIEPANVWGERRPGFYVIEARGNGGAIAVNRLAAAGAASSWVISAFDAGGFKYEPGSIVVPYSRTVEPVVARIASELGLRADGVRGRPPASARPIGRARVALYKSWVENADEGWTRWLLEKYEFGFSSLTDAEAGAGNLRAKFDVIVLPSAPAERLTRGHDSGAVPPEYAGGLGERGMEALKRFVEAGGTLICLDESCGLAIDLFNLPLRDVARDAGERLVCPGSILRVDLDPAHPLAYGMNPHTAGFFSFSSAYESIPGRSTIDGRGSGGNDSALQTIARYGSKDLLLSGFLQGEDVIAGRSAVVQAGVGAGRVVLLGFRVQHRAQSHATFRLLFNAILTSGGRPNL